MKIDGKELVDLLNKVRLEDAESAIELNEVELFKDKGVDSLTLASFYFAVEEKYNINIPDNQLGRIHSIQDLKKFIESNIN
jgi:acyl carrier protein